VSATEGRFAKTAAAEWTGVATLVVSTRVSMVGEFVDVATAVGRAADERALITLHGGSTAQISIASTLGRLVTEVKAVKAEPSELIHITIGAAVENREALSWYETKPLFGWRVLVPRTKDQAASLTAPLRT
jgi:uroporphyrinogen III methyltransferase / synthase